MATATYVSKDGKSPPVQVQTPVLGLVKFAGADGTAQLMKHDEFAKLYQPEVPKVKVEGTHLDPAAAPTDDVMGALKGLQASVDAIASKVDAIHALIPGAPATAAAPTEPPKAS